MMPKHVVLGGELRRKRVSNVETPPFCTWESFTIGICVLESR